MKCEQCHGSGKRLLRSYPGNELFPYPCESCNGTGISSCCEGATGLACDVTNEGKEKAGREFPRPA